MKENRIIFISIPEKTREQITEKLKGIFTLNGEIPFPVEITQDGEKTNLEELSMEMILSGMLRVIEAGEEKQEWLDYYRNLVFVLRPEILTEFTEAAIIKARNGDFDSALDILSVLDGLFQSAPILSLNRALVLEEQAAQCKRHSISGENKITREIFAIYEKLTKLEPPFGQALFNGGYFYLSQNEYAKAADCFSRYLNIANDDEDKKQIEKILKNIADNGLDDESFAEAQKFIKNGDTEEGLNSIRDFLERRSHAWNGWFLLGWALRLLCRWEDAATALRKAIELGGDNCDARNELAICLMEMGDTAGARRELETALFKDPENVKIISNLGTLALKTGDKEKAAAFFRTVLELDENDPIAKKFFGE